MSISTLPVPWDGLDWMDGWKGRRPQPHLGPHRRHSPRPDRHEAEGAQGAKRHMKGAEKD